MTSFHNRRRTRQNFEDHQRAERWRDRLAYAVTLVAILAWIVAARPLAEFIGSILK